MAKRLAIYLLRNDLRVHDNNCFQWCHLNADFVLPLYCFDPRHFQGTWHFGFPKTGPQRTKFLRESVQDLKMNLVARGSDLAIRHAKPETVLLDLVEVFKPDYKMVLVYQDEVTKEEVDVENALQKICKAESIEVKSIWGATLYHKEDLPFSISRIPDTYTGFRKAVEGESEVRPTTRVPDRLKPLPQLPQAFSLGSVPTNADLGVADFVADPRSAFPWNGGESTGLARLKYYLWDSNHVAKYKETRNGLIGPDYSTKFSAWLANGSLSPRQIYSEIKKYEQQRVANQSTYWVIFELLWRDYFRFVSMKYGDRIFYASGIMGKHVEWKKDMKKFELWKCGQTGVPFVDANMRELLASGWMSNRGRQNVASFLVKDLGIDWRLGAEWFESQLIDHDVCSNYGNWNYSAGIGNDPRENRKFNMIKQGLDYDPDGNFVRLWIPELDSIKTGKIHMLWTLPSSEMKGVSLGSDYPRPMVIAGEWGRHQGRAKPSDPYKGGATSGAGNQRGIDFYFSKKNGARK